MAYKIICHYDKLVIPWAVDRLKGVDGFSNYATSIGLVLDDEIVAAVIYDDYREKNKDINVSIVSEKLTKEFLNLAHAYPFKHLGCNRMTALIEKNHKKSRKFVERLNFSLEGVCRKASWRGKDLCIYGLLKEDAKYG